MKKNKKEPIPEHFESPEEAGNFWDVHDLADYWDQTSETDLKINLKRRHYFIGVAPESHKNYSAFPRQKEFLLKPWRICGSKKNYNKK